MDQKQIQKWIKDGPDKNLLLADARQRKQYMVLTS